MRVALVCFGFTAANRPLQPWRFYAEVVDGLRRDGHDVTVITDAAGDHTAGVEHVRSIRLPRTGNTALVRAIGRASPDVCVWNVGPTSALHFDPTRLAQLGIPSHAVFPAPLYGPADLRRLGIDRLVAMRKRLGVHLAGALIPRSLTQHLLEPFGSVIVHSRHTLERLVEAGVTRERLHLIPPGLSPDERIALPPVAEGIPFTVLYAGSPLAMRGVLDLVAAVADVRRSGLDVRLRVLSRGRGEYSADEERLARAIRRHDVTGAVTVRPGFLSREELRREMGEAHLIALPFQLVPSDMPLAVLEAMSWGRAVLGTRVACMTELLEGRGYLASPGDPPSLAREIRRSMKDHRERAFFTQAALEAARAFPDWPAVVGQVARLVDPTAAATQPGRGQIEVTA